MISWCQAFAFHKCNLYRYAADPTETLECTVCRHVEGLVTWDSVYFVQIALEGYGLCKLHSVDPS